MEISVKNPFQALQNRFGYGIYPSNSHTCAPVAQLDRALDFESIGRGFESLRARHSERIKMIESKGF